MGAMYHENKNLKEVETTITAIFEEDGHWYVQLDDEIFYPQGGGQKGDRGLLVVNGNKFRIVNTIKDKYGNGGLLLVESELPSGFNGSKAKSCLDWDFRYRQMKLHTCVHLHHCMLEETAKKTIPHPGTSSIEDGFAYNKYESSDFDPGIVEEANAKFKEIIGTNTPVFTYPDPEREKEGFRWWECGGHKIPCGGLHVSQLDEIGNVQISMSAKKGKTTIKFTLQGG